MLRRASTALFCALALVTPAFGQDVFVPRELKAIPVHPPKPKEVVRRAEPVTEADLKPAKETTGLTESTKPKVAKTETAPVKTEKTAPKEKAPAANDEAASKKTAKAEPAKEKSDKPAVTKEKPAVAKAPAAADDVATIKVEKTAAKESAPAKTVAKTEPAKEKKEKAAPAKDDSDLPTIKVEKATVSKEPAAKTVAKTETTKPEPTKEKAEKAPAAKEKAPTETTAKKSDAAVAKSEKAPAKDEPAKSIAKNDSVKVETVTAKTEKPAVKEQPATAKTEKPAVKEQPATVAVTKSLKEEKSPAKGETKVSKNDPVKMDVSVAKTEKPAPAKEKEKEKVAPAAAKPPAKSEALIAKVDPAPPREGPVNTSKILPVRADQVSIPTQKDPPQVIPAVSGTLVTGFTKIADGFDFPVGKPDAENYYKARGFRPNGHVGEDWDGTGGGDTDFRDPIYSIGDGIVVFARDVRLGWGNVVIVRHAYRENGEIRYIDALYGHLHNMSVSRGQRVARGQQIGTMGTAHGQYDAHLHFEIRKNLEIGMSRSKFQKSFSNYFDPTQFINSHRRLSGGGANYKVAMNTFTHDWAYNFDKNRSFGARKRSTSESSAALRKALTSR